MSAAPARWRTGSLPPPPTGGWRGWPAMVGPGIVMAGSAIGSGEWLLGPAVTARYGGALLWVTTLSLLAQLVYNLEASRYTLYCGEPILAGAFRLLPGPAFWFAAYLLLDLGAVLPYQIVHAATAAASIWRGAIVDPAGSLSDAALLGTLSYVMLALAMVPLVWGGKIYDSLRIIMSVKVAVVLAFLLFLAIGYSSWATWREILTGFVSFGQLPARDGSTVSLWAALVGGQGAALDRGGLPLVAAFAAIAGVGGLAQSTISNYTRDQGWGMGVHAGAIPAAFGGRQLALSHEGTAFVPGPGEMVRWRGWRRHVLRDQLVIWLPAALVGIALPSMLSLEFVTRGTTAGQWTLVGMTAGGVADRVGGLLGTLCWYGALACGLLVLLPNAASNADGFVRRWVDAAWLSVGALRRRPPREVAMVYFALLAGYFTLGVLFLSIERPMALIIAYGNLGNLALAVNCWHTLAVNVRLLPVEVRPGWAARAGLAAAGLYFFILAGLAFHALVA
jgi:hypothetical protein